jgi:hypothetical protein
MGFIKIKKYLIPPRTKVKELSKRGAHCKKNHQSDCCLRDAKKNMPIYYIINLLYMLVSKHNKTCVCVPTFGQNSANE